MRAGYSGLFGVSCWALIGISDTIVGGTYPWLGWIAVAGVPFCILLVVLDLRASRGKRS